LFLLVIEVSVFPVTRSALVLALTIAAVVGLLSPRATLAAGGSSSDAALQLSANDVYVAPQMLSQPWVHKTDAARLRAATTNANRRGVPTKVGVIAHYPKALRSPTDAAQALRSFLDFSGVLILVTPQGIGISSDELSNADIASIQRRVRAQCRVDAASCAIEAIQLSQPRVFAIQSKANRNAAIFWVVSVALFGIVVLVLVLMTRRKRGDVLAQPPTGASSTPTGT
jgi:hypothetical protein